MHEQVAPADLVEQAARVLHAREARLRDRHPRLGLQVGPVEARELHQVGEVEQALDLVDLVVAHVEPLAKPVEHAARRRGRDLDPHDVAEAAAAELGLDGLEKVVGVVRHLEVGVTGDAEEHALGDLHPGEERRQEVRDHRLERHEPRSGVDEPVEPFRHLDAGEPLLGAVRIDGEHAQREREPGDVRKRLPGPDRERRQHRVDVPREHGLEALQLLGRALLDGHDLDALGGERRAQLALPELGLAAGQLGHARLEGGQRLGRREPVGRPDGEPGSLLVHQAGDAHHEELVEVGGEDRAELHPLEQRLLLLGCQVEHARVELDPRELAVEEARFGGDRAGRHALEHYPSVRRAPGAAGRESGYASSVPSASTSCRSKCAIRRSDSGSR